MDELVALYEIIQIDRVSDVFRLLYPDLSDKTSLLFCSIFNVSLGHCTGLSRVSYEIFLSSVASIAILVRWCC